jgi:hypothetical protein
MKSSISITAVHLDAAKTADQSSGSIKVSLEIDGCWILILDEKFDSDGFHISHIIEGSGIKKIKKGIL